MDMGNAGKEICMKDVLIQITGTQMTDGDDEVIELTTVGKLGEKNGKWYLSYDEGSGIGAEDVTTILKIEEEKMVTMQRSGQLQTRLTIEKGQRHLCHYQTIQGEMMIGVFGEKIKNSISYTGGRLYLSYTIDINSGFISRNQIEILIKETASNVQTCS